MTTANRWVDEWANGFGGQEEVMIKQVQGSGTRFSSCEESGKERQVRAQF